MAITKQIQLLFVLTICLMLPVNVIGSYDTHTPYQGKGEKVTVSKPADNYGKEKYEEKHYGHQPYGFGYNIDDGYGNKQWRHEKSGNPHQVSGSYGFKDKNGIYREVAYIADKNGFRAVVKTTEPGTTSTDPAYVKLLSQPVQIPYKVLETKAAQQASTTHYQPLSDQRRLPAVQNSSPAQQAEAAKDKDYQVGNNYNGQYTATNYRHKELPIKFDQQLLYLKPISGNTANGYQSQYNPGNQKPNYRD